LRLVYAIFGGDGASRSTGRGDVETDDYNFGLLNIPPHHPRT